MKRVRKGTWVLYACFYVQAWLWVFAIEVAARSASIPDAAGFATVTTLLVSAVVFLGVLGAWHSSSVWSRRKGAMTGPLVLEGSGVEHLYAQYRTLISDFTQDNLDRYFIAEREFAEAARTDSRLETVRPAVKLMGDTVRERAAEEKLVNSPPPGAVGYGSLSQDAAKGHVSQVDDEMLKQLALARWEGEGGAVVAREWGDMPSDNS